MMTSNVLETLLLCEVTDIFKYIDHNQRKVRGVCHILGATN